MTEPKIPDANNVNCINCPECGGVGLAYHLGYALHGAVAKLYDYCLLCDGIGWVSVEIEQPK